MSRLQRQYLSEFYDITCIWDPRQQPGNICSFFSANDLAKKEKNDQKFTFPTHRSNPSANCFCLLWIVLLCCAGTFAFLKAAYSAAIPDTDYLGRLKELITLLKNSVYSFNQTLSDFDCLSNLHSLGTSFQQCWFCINTCVNFMQPFEKIANSNLLWSPK